VLLQLAEVLVLQVQDDSHIDLVAEPQQPAEEHLGLARDARRMTGLANMGQRIGHRIHP